MANTTLGSIVSAAVEEIKEPSIDEFDPENILQARVIDECNNAVVEILARHRYRWGLKRTTLTTADDLTTGTVAVTNGSTAVTSKDASGADADNFTDVAVGQYLRVTGDYTSYQISAVDTASSPDTVTLETAYVGTTSAAAAYTILQDEYAISTSDFGELKAVGFGEGATWYEDARASRPRAQVRLVSHADILSACGGDFHRDTSGKPRLIARIGVDSSNQPLFKVWPYPTAQYVLDLWYVPKFTTATAFSTPLFGGDAPDLAYVAIEARACAASARFDESTTQQSYWEGRYRALLNELVRGQTTLTPNTMGVQSYRRYARGGVRGESQHWFDTAPARLS